MGYSTEFEGVLKFTNDPTASQLQALTQLFDQDCRNHPEWESFSLEADFDDLSYFNLRITDDFRGIEWDGTEKSYAMVGIVNLVLGLMHRDFPEFGLSGSLKAQGEEFDDRWVLEISPQGRATKRDVVLTGTRCTCPKCGEEFILETATE